MSDSVELLLDSAAEEVVRRDWVRLLELDLPSQARHTSPSNRPHITLAAAPAIDGALDAALRGAVRDLPQEVRFGGLLLFGGGRRTFILVRQVVVSAALTDLHRGVGDALTGLQGQFATTLTGNWTPHVTLARGLSADQVGQAVAAVQAEPAAATAVAARRWDSSARVTVDLSR
ncbi:2'-5' RNA ligase family protein [Arthrobacter zhaoguopingii]|uniref:2'-5' RNA ligase family protein n=1 Tax=Arthrobacter zhaoguopingii TaxID=2681491 RepID=UPI00135A595E|nr:2'-5' RNA ligase family protein [Arthrobacter zhaoguopingii]